MQVDTGWARAATVRDVLIDRLRSRILIPETSPSPRTGWWGPLVAVCLAVATIAEAIFADWPDGIETLLASLVVTCLIALPRTRIAEVFAALVLATLFAALIALVRGTLVDYSYGASLAVVWILYRVGRWAAPRAVPAALAFAAVVVPLVDLWSSSDSMTWQLALTDAGFNALVIGAGLLVRSSAATRLEAARADIAEQQQRFANEIHDSVAHHMSAIAVRAEGARQFAVSPDAQAALTDIKQSAALGLTDLRQLLATMRAGNSPLPRQSALVDLHGLAESPSDIPVTVAIDPGLGDVQPSVADAVYAIAREGLTNVRRHAQDASGATIRVVRSGHHVVVEIQDDGANQPGSTVPGNGIQSMTDRACALGGSLTAGASPPNGWLVTASLPAKPRWRQGQR